MAVLIYITCFTNHCSHVSHITSIWGERVSHVVELLFLLCFAGTEKSTHEVQTFAWVIFAIHSFGRQQNALNHSLVTVSNGKRNNINFQIYDSTCPTMVCLPSCVHHHFGTILCMRCHRQDYVKQKWIMNAILERDYTRLAPASDVSAIVGTWMSVNVEQFVCQSLLQPSEDDFNGNSCV